MAQIYLSNKLATRGQQITLYETEISLVEEENKKLKSEIASSGCLSKLKETASEKGFVKTSQIVNLSSKIPVALNP
jgi:cell division protein FtsL